MKEMASAVDEATWCDSHCHLTADRFNEDRREVIERAREAGLKVMLWHEERPEVIRELEGLPIYGVCGNAPELL